ncbi:hypothetical protein HHK36_015991 [Tetracentron sinense]|uniref:RING-type domain-containing protein n=1 Tax=Tetracentron sinense TaxID=13715 RepID=A0A835DEA3_TETSI|nr:hypothetical protein HHK36_015991 [Tetracentron sinense]
MEASGSNLDPFRNSSGSSNSGIYGMHLPATNLIQALLEYSGFLRTRSSHQESENLINGGVAAGSRDHIENRLDDSAAGSSGGEVSIRIIGAGEQEHVRVAAGLPPLSFARVREGNSGESDLSTEQMAGTPAPAAASDHRGDARSDGRAGDVVFSSSFSSSSSSSSSSSFSAVNSGSGSSDGETGNGVGGNNRDSSYQRYDIQQIAKWIEQILPFSLLLLVVFIRQHLQGFFVTVWIAGVMFKSNDILGKQTALKVLVIVGFCREREKSWFSLASLQFSCSTCLVFTGGIEMTIFYNPLVMLPPKEIPPFWHAIFIIMVNDTMVRQTAMVFKFILLIYYKNSRGRNYRKQGQMLTLVEYLLLLYRALLPAPVWYRFFLNKEYGSLFSSLTTGLYLTFKLTSVVEKVQSFFAALKALSRKEVHYGSYAMPEQGSDIPVSHLQILQEHLLVGQKNNIERVFLAMFLLALQAKAWVSLEVIAAGDLCAICQEKMHAPILLRCKHIFCEDCVSE